MDFEIVLFSGAGCELVYHSNVWDNLSVADVCRMGLYRTVEADRGDVVSHDGDGVYPAAVCGIPVYEDCSGCGSSGVCAFVQSSGLQKGSIRFWRNSGRKDRHPGCGWCGSGRNPADSWMLDTFSCFWNGKSYGFRNVVVSFGTACRVFWYFL